MDKMFLALDTEDDSKGNVKIINFFDGKDHVTFCNGNVRLQAWDYLQQLGPSKKSSKPSVQVWACNMEYDLINLFGPWLGKLTTLQYVGSGLMRGIYMESKVTFLDTLRHWAMTVEKMGEFLKLPKMEKDFQSVEYCRRDTEIVWYFVEKMISKYEDLNLPVRATLPAEAMLLFKQFYPYEFVRLPDHIRKFFREAYYGGRVEVFRLGEISANRTCQGWDNLTYHYDINSLYPSVMVDYSYPDLESWKSTFNPDFSKEGIFKGWVYVPEIEYPCLPYKYNHETLYCYGSLYGSWCYPEIRQLLKDGGKVVKTKQAIEFDETEKPFIEYVKFCYNKRLEAQTDLDNLFWKLMQNSLYGKFGSYKGLEMIYNDRQFILDIKSPYANIIWSAYVTCYGRLRLLKHLRSCSDVYYTDTDSLFTPDSLPVSTKLGNLKLEGTYKKVTFVGNKLYTLDNISKAKGVPKNVAKDFIRTGRAVYRRPARFRESRRSFLTANVWYEVEKRLHKEYTKRKILKDGSTEPWDINSYRLFKG